MEKEAHDRLYLLDVPFKARCLLSVQKYVARSLGRAFGQAFLFCNTHSPFPIQNQMKHEEPSAFGYHLHSSRYEDLLEFQRALVAN